MAYGKECHLEVVYHRPTKQVPNASHFHLGMPALLTSCGQLQLAFQFLTASEEHIKA